MLIAIKRYELSAVAEEDLGNIYDYTLSEFGENQAVKYLNGLEQTFLTLIDQPELGRKRDEISVDLRSLAYEKHVIFYGIMRESILIVRVLHGSRDIPKFLE